MNSNIPSQAFAPPCKHQLQNAFKLLQDEECPQAYSLLKECISEEKNEAILAELHYFAALCAVAMENQELEKKHFQRIVQLNAETKGGMHITTLALHFLGNPEAAIAQGEKTLEKYPGSIKTCTVLAKIHGSQGNEEKKIEYLERAKKIESESTFGNVKVMDMNQINSNSEEKVKEEILTDGILDLAIGDNKAALENFEEVLKMEPSNIEALGGAAAARAQLGDFDQALVVVNRALSIATKEDKERLLKLKETIEKGLEEKKEEEKTEEG